MALTTPSDWQQNTKPQQYKEEGSGLTAKQTDMAGSMYPGAFKPSEPKPQEATVSAPEQQMEKATEQQKEPSKQQQQQEQQRASGIQQKVQEVSGKIGSFSYKLQEYVNKFLTSPTETFGVSAAYNPVTGQVETKESGAMLDPAVKEKQAQQARITASMSPFIEKLQTGNGYRAKSFMEAMKGQLGGDDASAQLMQMVDTLDNLQKSGYGQSSEAKALQQQMEQMDTFGLASELRNAKKKYENLMGLGAASDATKWYGETGKEGKTAMELANLGPDAIKDEMQKAMVSASGLFSGDVESSLAQEYDRQSAEAQRAGQLDEKSNSMLSDALDTVFSDTEYGLVESRNTINETMNSPEIKQEIDAILKGTPGADLWMDMLGEGGSAYDVIMAALKDPKSGLASEERAVLTKYLGELDKGGTGQLSSWIQEMKDTGSFTVMNSNNEPTAVHPTAATKQEILRILTDPNIDKPTALKKVKEIVDNIAINDVNKPGQTISTFMKDILAKGDDPDGLAESTRNFTMNLGNSIKTFVKSKTADTFKNAMIKLAGSFIPGIAGMDLDQMSKAFHALPKETQDSITKAVKNSIEGTMVQADKDVKAKTEEAVSGAVAAISGVPGDPTKIGKLSEIKNETDRLNTIVEAVTNFIPNTYSTYSGNLYKQVAAADKGIAAIHQNLMAEDWVKASLEQGILTLPEVNTIAAATSLSQLIPSIQQALPWLHIPAEEGLSFAFDTGTGRVDMNKVRDFMKKINGYLTEFKTGGATNLTKFTAWAESPTGMKGAIDANNKVAGQATNAIATLGETTNRLNATLNNVKKLVKQGTDGYATQIDPESILNELVGASEQPGTMEALEGMQITQDPSGAPTLSFSGKSGITVTKGPNGMPQLSFKDGSFMPVTDEMIRQIIAAKGTTTGSGIGGISQAGPGAELGQANLPSGMTVPVKQAPVAPTPVVTATPEITPSEGTHIGDTKANEAYAADAERAANIARIGALPNYRGSSEQEIASMADMGYSLPSTIDFSRMSNEQISELAGSLGLPERGVSSTVDFSTLTDAEIAGLAGGIGQGRRDGEDGEGVDWGAGGGYGGQDSRE